MNRSATLVVLDRNGKPLGTFGPIIASGDFRDTVDLTDRAAAAGLELVILRLLQTPGPVEHDITHCLYAAEASGRIPANVLLPLSADVALDDHPLRLPYARPGGIAADLRWADAALHARGRQRVGRPQQHRTWNLSCVHRLTLDDGATAWLKVVPSFFAHEGAMLKFMHESATATRVPTLLGLDPDNGRVLLEHVDGPLLWGVPIERWVDVIDAHVATQVALRERADELLALGAPDGRNDAFLAAIARLTGRADVRNCVPGGLLAPLDALVDSLPATLAVLEACGVPTTLVHGDLHPGNVLGSSAGPVVLDWGDACVAHPFFDLPALCHGMPEADHAAIEQRFIDAWQAELPGADAARAAVLMKPLSALCKALVYRNFLDHIEPSEHHYHIDDVPNWLTEAVRRSGR